MNFPNLASAFLISAEKTTWIQDPRILLFSDYGWALMDFWVGKLWGVSQSLAWDLWQNLDIANTSFRRAMQNRDTTNRGSKGLDPKPLRWLD